MNRQNICFSLTLGSHLQCRVVQFLFPKCINEIFLLNSSNISVFSIFNFNLRKKISLKINEHALKNYRPWLSFTFAAAAKQNNATTVTVTKFGIIFHIYERNHLLY